MSIELILKGEPKSTSHIYKVSCRGKYAGVYMSATGKSIKLSYQWQAKSQYKGKPIEGDLEVWIELFFGTKRKADWDNFNKLIMDALTGIVWVDDSQITEAHVSKMYCKENPRIEIIIKKL